MGISRVKTLDGLHLAFPVTKNTFKVQQQKDNSTETTHHHQIEEEYERLNMLYNETKEKYGHLCK